MVCGIGVPETRQQASEPAWKVPLAIPDAPHAGVPAACGVRTALGVLVGTGPGVADPVAVAVTVAVGLGVAVGLPPGVANSGVPVAGAAPPR